MARVTTSSQQFGTNPAYSFGYTYDLSRALHTETYPSGRIVTNAFDAAGRINGVTGSVAPTSYASGVTYAAQGAIQALTLGSGLSESWGFNTRQQPNSLQVTSTPQLNLGWGYGPDANNNGNVQTHTIASFRDRSRTSPPVLIARALNPSSLSS